MYLLFSFPACSNSLLLYSIFLIQEVNLRGMNPWSFNYWCISFSFTKRLWNLFVYFLLQKQNHCFVIIPGKFIPSSLIYNFILIVIFLFPVRFNALLNHIIWFFCFSKPFSLTCRNNILVLLLVLFCRSSFKFPLLLHSVLSCFYSLYHIFS